MSEQGRPGRGEGGAPAIREVKARHEERLLSMPGVVSVGVGRCPDGSPAIIVGLDRPRPETVEGIPGELEGYRVRVEITGKMRTL